ncbi:MAG: sugar ABC transporter permease [Thermomicrobiales bacterium]|jgi:multiple sugar transport system permease protein|nr:sugar ABC transporter permease [Thermomicrobiales bacterium]
MKRSARRSYAVAIAPALVLMAIFYLGPAIWAVYISTTPMSLVGPDAGSTRFIGLDNYRAIWKHPDFPTFVWNTVVYTAGVAVIGATIGGLLIALVIDRARRDGNRLAMAAFSAVVLAGICPVPLVGSMWGIILDYRDGVLNALLTTAGFDRVDWLGERPMLMVIVAEVWRTVGLAMIVFYGALRTLPASVGEAAMLDGASSWTRFRTITLPQIMPTAGLVLLMTTILAAGSFLLNEILTGGGTALQTETLALYSFHAALIDFRIAYGAALSVVILLFTLVCAVVYLRIAEKRP